MSDKNRKKRKYVWARAAIARALSEGRLPWTELLERSGVSRGALSANLRKMIRDGSVVIEMDADRRPPRTLYALGKTIPIYVEEPLVKGEHMDFMDAMQELEEAEEKTGVPEVSVKSAEVLEKGLEDIIFSSAEFAVVGGLLKSSRKTLFIKPSASSSHLAIGRPTIRWFEGSMEDAKQLLIKDALENALDLASHTWEMITETPVENTIKEIAKETYEEVGQYWRKKVRSGVHLKMKELEEKGVFRVMNKNGVGIVFLSLEDFVEQNRKRFEKKYGIVDVWRYFTTRFIRAIETGDWSQR